jgi:hypothetical protein
MMTHRVLSSLASVTLLATSLTAQEAVTAAPPVADSVPGVVAPAPASAVLPIAAPPLLEQPKAADPVKEGFTVGPLYAGARIWLGGLAGGTLAFGGMIEKGIKKPGEMGPGIVSVGAGVDYYSFNNAFFGYSYIPITAFGNYNFVIKDNKKLSPYVGLGLGYMLINASARGVGNFLAEASYLYVAGQLGARYFVSDKLALQAQAGFGIGALSIGATFRL